MAIDMRITGNGTWSGTQAELISYTVDEESTPFSGDDSSGATGQIAFDVISNSDTILLMNDDIELVDGSNGRTKARVSSLSDTDGVTSVVADGRLNLLTATKTLPPFTGQLGTALTTYFNMCGINDGIVIDPTISTRNTTLQGWTGSVWDYIKFICVVEQIEVSLVSSNVVVRPLRLRVADVEKNSTKTVAIEKANLAKSVEVVCYNNQYVTNGMVWPKEGVWTEDTEVYQVDAAQEIKVEIPVEYSLVSLMQPTCVLSVPRDYVGNSVYAVAGSDGLPIPPDQWTHGGGSVTLEIGPDQKTIIATIKGAVETKYAPYSLSVNAGPSDTYSALRIRGTGVKFTPETFTFFTGADPDSTAQDVGLTIDNPAVRTPADAATVGINAALKFATPQATLSASTVVINRRGEVGSVNYMSFGGFDSLQGTRTFSTYDTSVGTKTFGTQDAELELVGKDDFENQAFGNAAGASVFDNAAWYRIRTATIVPDSTSYTAEADTTFNDLNASYGSTMTFSQFDGKFTGMTFSEHALVPLRVG